MPTSWTDSIAAGEAAPAASGGGGSCSARSSYVPPHLRNRQASSEPPAPATSAPSFDNARPGYAAGSGPRWGGPGRDHGRSGFVGGGSGGSGGGWDRGREWEVSPFENEESAEQAFRDQKNTGINFDAYEDIPVETSGDNVPPPVNTFAEIDLGDALNQNIRRCKYVRPTPVSGTPSRSLSLGATSWPAPRLVRGRRLCFASRL